MNVLNNINYIDDLEYQDVHVWKIDLNIKNRNINISLANELNIILSADELSKASKFHTCQLQTKYIICRGLLRMILSKYIDEEPRKLIFETNEYGKPSIAYPLNKYHFNTSHSHNFALIAISRHQVGIDIEKMITFANMKECAEDIFTHDEITTLNNWTDSMSIKCFFDLWTRKEAYIKALGYGLSLPLKSFTVPSLDSTGYIGCVHQHTCSLTKYLNNTWEIYSFPALEMSYRSALSIPFKAANIKFINLDIKSCLQ